MSEQSKYYQMLAKAVVSNADGIIAALDQYLAKADDDLADALADEGYAETEDTVKAINTMQDEVAEILQNQTDDFVAALEIVSGSEWADAQKAVSEMLEKDDIAEWVEGAATEMFQTEVPKLSLFSGN